MRNRTKDLTITSLFAAIIFIASLDIMKIQLGPVPISLQSLVVMVTAGLLGAKRGAIATFIGLLIYAIMFGKIFGPTIGYIVAMPIAAYLIGIVHERTEIFGLRFITMILAGIYLIYLIGVPVLKVMTGLDWKTSFSVGVIPFLLGDFIKVLFASIITQKSKHLAIV